MNGPVVHHTLESPFLFDQDYDSFWYCYSQSLSTKVIFWLGEKYPNLVITLWKIYFAVIETFTGFLCVYWSRLWFVLVLVFSQLEYKSDILSSLPTWGKLGEKYPNLVITLWKIYFEGIETFIGFLFVYWSRLWLGIVILTAWVQKWYSVFLAYIGEIGPKISKFSNNAVEKYISQW